MNTQVTFCALCEALCGVVATVEGGRVTKVRPDRDHPVSKGFACPKGIALPDVLNDPDRVTQPMKRMDDGAFIPITWDVALSEIGWRLKRIIGEHGRSSVGAYLGNPTAFNYGAFFWAKGLCSALGSPHLYATASLDINNYWAAGALLYGHPMVNPIPDLDRTDFLLMVGANMLVSHASMVTAPRIRERLHGIVHRGGRIVVVDPRRSETAQAFEHLPIRADQDAWLLVSLLQVVFSEGLADRRALASQASGVAFLEDLVAASPPEVTEARTGIAANRVRELARAFAGAPRAVAHGRTGASLGQASTLVKYLLDALNLVTGNFDAAGGAVLGRPLIDLAAIAWMLGQATYGTWTTRVDGFPELMGTSPVATLAREITTPGRGQLRALIVCAGNPGHTGPGSAAIQAALLELELLVTIDLYVTDTGRRADYVLPGTTGLERDQYPWLIAANGVVPYAQWSPKVVEPPELCREEWWILDQIARRIGVVPSPSPAARALGRFGVRLAPATLFDLFLRLRPEGDLFGLRRRGWSRKKLWAAPRGAPLADSCPIGVARRHIRHKDKRVHLDHAAIRSEFDRLAATPVADADYPLRLISLRELHSLNSWMHNVPRLMDGRTQRLRMHPDDAARSGIEDGEMAAVTSRAGRIEVEVRITDEVMPGTVALPQGWGHVKGGNWKRAIAAGGVNYNLLTSDDPRDHDRLSGNAWFNGVPIRVTPARPALSRALS